MTVIASYQFGGAQILIGDLLVSEQDHPAAKGHLVLPTGAVERGQATLHGRLPVSFVQKIDIVHARLAVGLAGSLASAERLSAHLRWRCEDHGRTFETFSKFFGTIDWSEYPQLSVIALYAHEGNMHVLRSSDVREINLDSIKNAYVSGSGSEHMVRVMTELDSDLSMNAQLPNPLVSAMNIVARLVFEERLYHEPTMNAFGGGYEICYFGGGAFRKFDDFTVTKISLDCDTHVIRRLGIGVVLATKYWSGDLCLSSIATDARGEMNATVHHIPPLFTGVVKQFKKPPPFRLLGALHMISVELKWRGKALEVYYSTRPASEVGRSGFCGVKSRTIRTSVLTPLTMRMTINQAWYEQIVAAARDQLATKHGRVTKFAVDDNRVTPNDR